jgi:GNAT superfamily N-acetyltransferase
MMVARRAPEVASFHPPTPTQLSTSVRRASIDDLALLVELMREFYAEGGFPLGVDAATRAFRTLLEQPHLGRVWLGGHEGAPSGYVVLTLGFSMEFGGPRGFVDDFFVRPYHRGRGLGAALLAQVRAECASLGVRGLCVETGPDGHPARRLYLRSGFVDSGRALLSQQLGPALHE